jgi:hypothetical protein
VSIERCIVITLLFKCNKDSDDTNIGRDDIRLIIARKFHETVSMMGAPRYHQVFATAVTGSVWRGKRENRISVIV